MGVVISKKPCSVMDFRRAATTLHRRLKWNGGICVNGLPQHTNYPVRPGDVITVLLDEPEPEYDLLSPSINGNVK